MKIVTSWTLLLPMISEDMKIKPIVISFNHYLHFLIIYDHIHQYFNTIWFIKPLVPIHFSRMKKNLCDSQYNSEMLVDKSFFSGISHNLNKEPTFQSRFSLHLCFDYLWMKHLQISVRDIVTIHHEWSNELLWHVRSININKGYIRDIDRIWVRYVHPQPYLRHT